MLHQARQGEPGTASYELDCTVAVLPAGNPPRTQGVTSFGRGRRCASPAQCRAWFCVRLLFWFQGIPLCAQLWHTPTLLALAAVFSFVMTMRFREGSIIIRPAMRAAAARVLPAPNTPETHRSVRPVRIAKTREETILRKCPSCCCRNCWHTLLYAICSSLSPS